MDRKNHLMEKEDNLPNLRFWVRHIYFPGCNQLKLFQFKHLKVYQGLFLFSVWELETPFGLFPCSRLGKTADCNPDQHRVYKFTAFQDGNHPNLLVNRSRTYALRGVLLLFGPVENPV